MTKGYIECEGEGWKPDREYERITRLESVVVVMVVGEEEKNGLSVMIRPFGRPSGSGSAASAHAHAPSSSASV